MQPIDVIWIYLWDKRNGGHSEHVLLKKMDPLS